MMVVHSLFGGIVPFDNGTGSQVKGRFCLPYSGAESGAANYPPNSRSSR